MNDTKVTSCVFSCFDSSKKKNAWLLGIIKKIRKIDMPVHWLKYSTQSTWSYVEMYERISGEKYRKSIYGGGSIPDLKLFRSFWWLLINFALFENHRKIPSGILRPSSTHFCRMWCFSRIFPAGVRYHRLGTKRLDMFTQNIIMSKL